MAKTTNPISLGRASCFACRNSKRRCDRTLPTCQLCQRKNVECRYPRRRGQRSASPPPVTATSHSNTAVSNSQSPFGLGNSTSSYVDASSVIAGLGETAADGHAAASISTLAAPTAIQFLAPDLYHSLRLQAGSRDTDVPSNVLDHLGDRREMREVTNTFLSLTRSWMPIINGKRHLSAVLNPLLTPLTRPTALLALAMKLYCASADSQLEREQKHSLYLLTKRFCGEVERSDEMSISTMQAAVFIAVFEMGEAIYPAAYLTVGNLTRYGIAMGLDKINQDRIGSSYLRAAAIGVPWMEVEEVRRVWWGVLILDRQLNASHPTWSLVTTDPAFEDYLPVDDEKFYDASATPEDASPISHAFHHRLGAFARLCQATYLISKVLELARAATRQSSSSPTDEPPCDPAQLCRTLEALVRANEVEVSIRKLPFCTQSLVSYIGVLLLQNQRWQQRHQSSPETPPAEANDLIYQETHSALETLDRMSKMVCHEDAGDGPSPRKGHSTLFLVELVYQAISTLMTIKEGFPPSEFQDKMESLRWLLKCMIRRWHLAGIYDRILEAKEAIIAATEI